MASVLCAAITIFSRTNGPARSLLFFGRIAERSGDDYRQVFRKVSSAELLDDFAHQIHRNAEIAKEKFRSEEHTSELQSLMRISYAVFCLKKNNQQTTVPISIIIVPCPVS